MKRIALLTASVLLLAGCSAAPEPDDGRVRIVASTNVYGDIAQTIGGDFVNVTSLIDGANQDPHSFEASAQDQLAMSKADLVIENGGGYDPFMETLLAAAGADTETITVYTEFADFMSAYDSALPMSNEHVWYSFLAMKVLSDHLATSLSELDPEHADTFADNAAAFDAQLDTLGQRAAGSGYKKLAMTEPVPEYLLVTAGLFNATPSGFTEAIEEGSDVPPLALEQTLDLFSNDEVVLLAYNEQTASPETERVRSAAEAAGIPVVNFTETLPEGETYVSWMTANVDNLLAARG